MNELALFAGAGGGILGGILSGFRTVCAVEIEAFPREVLLRRQRDGLLPMFPIWNDARTFDGRPWRGLVDVVTAGFPCQPFSVAGKNLGADDPRNGWPATRRILGDVRPSFALLENVPGLLAHRYFGRILGDLAEIGFAAEWDCLPASAVGAPHQRDRLWIVAYSLERGIREQQQRIERWTAEHRQAVTQHDGANRTIPVPSSEPWRLDARQGRPGEETTESVGRREEVADTDGAGCEERRGTQSVRAEFAPAERGGEGRGDVSWWATEPALGRVVNGMADRVGQLTALGNGQVPLVAAAAWDLLLKRIGGGA